MPQKNRHPKKYLEDGVTLNPKWKPRAKPSSNRGHSGKKLSKYNRGEFVSWDGEGITLDDGRHVYALLANSRGEYIMNPEGLGTWECLDFLCNQSEKYNLAIHAGFVFSYDTAMMLFADMDYNTVKDIWENKRPSGVWWGEFKIKYVNRKCLTVQRIGEIPYIHKKINDEWKLQLNVIQSIQLWDVFGFFQSSFVEAIEDWLGKDYDKLEMIKSGKLHRGSFTEETLEKEVLPYCLAEVETCDKLLGLLLTYLKDAGIQISRWDGSGAISAALLKKYGIKSHMADLPPDVQEAAQHGYFGGRIELCKYGHYVGDIYHYDIHSAYPSAQTECPSLANGHWEHLEYDSNYDYFFGESQFTIFHVEWCLSTVEIDYNADWSIYPFPYREISGQVIFPFEGSGWYWYPEVNSALHALSKYKERYPDAYIKITEAYRFIEHDSSIRPFTWLRDLYNLRAQWKRIGRAAQKVVKLGINGSYGKTAQHSGYNPDTGRKPPFHNLAWAGYITSKTRSMLFDACMQKPQDVLMLATDGVFSLSPLDLPCTDELGAWEYELHEEIVIVQSGVYFHKSWDEKKQVHKWATFCRGFDKGTITHEKVLGAWKKKKYTVYFPSTRFQGMGTSTTSRKAWERRGQWVQVGEERFNEGKQPEIGRALTTWTKGTKRGEPITSGGKPQWSTKGHIRPDEGLINTFAAFNHAGKMISNIYKLPWEMDVPIEGFLDGIPAKIVDDEHLESEA